ncbi:stromelysin-1-like [Amphiura filiformis]|uniref:stromelysin-1-like n=1 Tax=Amphiura filiformis TaxID=82378 RepID=UPI003B21B59A
MGPRNNVFVVFMLCAILSTIESRPSKSKTPSPTTTDQRQHRHEYDDVNQVKQSSDNGNSHVGRPYGNDIMMRGRPKTKDMDKAIKYMYKYGYMPVPNNPASKMPEMTPENIKENLRKMQMMMGVPTTGELDSVTMEMIDTPRCGVHDPVDAMIVPNDLDISDEILQMSPQKFVHFGQKWSRNNITYRILNFPYMLDRDDAYASIQQAFKVWSDVRPLTFTERVAGYADIYLNFGRYDHGDYYPFDGRGGTLAHAFLSQSGQGDLEGDVHFDDDEYFTYQSYQGTNLFYVAAHEIGHAIGLHHSLNSMALMAPFINPYDPEFTLHPDDIAGIQDLYGIASATDRPTPDVTSTVTQSSTTAHVTTSPPPMETSSLTEDKITTITSSSSEATEAESSPEGSGDPSSSYPFHSSSLSASSVADYPSSEFYERCPPYHTYFTDGNYTNIGTETTNSNCKFTFDAVASYRGEIFAFKDNRYWRITRDSGLISPLNGDDATYFFESFPNNIDAAYEQYLSSKLFVFKGSNYYVYNGIFLESGPHPISLLDPSLPSDVDAVLTWGEWHKTYFFKDDLVWRFDERYHRVDDGWPWLIKEIWTGVPHYLTSAFRWGGYTNFLQGNQLYAYDDYCYYVDPRNNPKSFSLEFINDDCPKL